MQEQEIEQIEFRSAVKGVESLPSDPGEENICLGCE